MYPTISENLIAYSVWSNSLAFEFVALPAGSNPDQNWKIEYGIHPSWVEWLASDSCTPAIHQCHSKLYQQGWRVIRVDNLHFHSNSGYLVWIMKDRDGAWLLEGLPNGDAGFPSALVESDSILPTVIRNQYGQVPV